MVDTFNFPNHIVKTKYPNNSNSLQFGRSYKFVAAPNAPPQRQFTLSFPGMSFFYSSGTTIDATINPTFNYKALRNFYEAHLLHIIFIYPHPEFGNINVRFLNPLEDPDPIPGGNGAQGPFQLVFEEQP